MYGYIYLTANNVNNKIYIGKHKSEKFNPEYYGSGKLINIAINKYGKENFTVHLLCICNSLQELNDKEKFFIKSLNSTNLSIGYNISNGGDGGNTTGGKICVHKDNCHKYINLSELSYYLSIGYIPGRSDECKQNVSKNIPSRKGEHNSFYGKHHSEYSRKLIGLTSGKRIGYGDNNIAKRLDVREKISQKAKRPSNYFRTHSFYYINNGYIEQRIARDGKPIPEGFTEGRLPRSWMTDGQKELLVYNTDIIEYQSKGYNLGRLSRV